MNTEGLIKDIYKHKKALSIIYGFTIVINLILMSIIMCCYLQCVDDLNLYITFTINNLVISLIISLFITYKVIKVMRTYQRLERLITELEEAVMHDKFNIFIKIMTKINFKLPFFKKYLKGGVDEY